ncbi:hypothetical protein HanRHA438_Chr12g0549551 [Helianthus annuus]|nr:hypothetical protein HanRHA438_Chr12g0549551 [Helianthus annuus]
MQTVFYNLTLAATKIFPAAKLHRTLSTGRKPNRKPPLTTTVATILRHFSCLPATSQCHRHLCYSTNNHIPPCTTINSRHPTFCRHSIRQRNTRLEKQKPDNSRSSSKHRHTR